MCLGGQSRRTHRRRWRIRPGRNLYDDVLEVEKNAFGSAFIFFFLRIQFAVIRGSGVDEGKGEYNNQRCIIS